MLARNLTNYLANLAVIWGLIAFYLYGKFYPHWLAPASKLALVTGAVGYTLYGLGRFIFFPGDRVHESNGLLAWQAVRHWAIHRRFPDPPEGQAQHPATTALLFLGVKAFFVPAMVNFLLSNLSDVGRFWGACDLEMLDHAMLTGPVFQLILAVFFLVDTLYFTFGYLVDSTAWGTQVRSVEPTLLGWGTALICYPPFNSIMGRMGVGWYSDENQHFRQPEVDLAVRAILVVFRYLSWGHFGTGFALLESYQSRGGGSRPVCGDPASGVCDKSTGMVAVHAASVESGGLGERGAVVLDLLLAGSDGRATLEFGDGLPKLPSRRKAPFYPRPVVIGTFQNSASC